MSSKPTCSEVELSTSRDARGSGAPLAGVGDNIEYAYGTGKHDGRRNASVLQSPDPARAAVLLQEAATPAL